MDMIDYSGLNATVAEEFQRQKNVPQTLEFKENFEITNVKDIDGYKKFYKKPISKEEPDYTIQILKKVITMKDERGEEVKKTILSADEKNVKSF